MPGPLQSLYHYRMTEELSGYQSAVAAGDAALRTGSVEEARACFERAVAAAGDDGEAAEALCRLGRAYGSLGRYAEAESALQEALRRAAGQPATLAHTRFQLGTVRWMRGEMKTARAFLEEAQTDFKRLGLVRDRASALNSLGLVLLAMGAYQRAIDAFDESSRLCEGLGFLVGVIISCSNLGECYYDLNAIARAREMFQYCLDLAAQHDTQAVAAAPLCNLGRAQAEAGELDQALVTIGRGIALADEYQREYLHTQGLFVLGEVRLLREEVAEAERAGRELAERAGEVSSHRAEARLLLGRCHLARGKSLEALAALQEGLLDAQASFSTMLILRFHAALGQIVDHPAIAQVHRRIARELADQITDTLDDKALQQFFRDSPLVRSIAG